MQDILRQRGSGQADTSMAPEDTVDEKRFIRNLATAHEEPLGLGFTAGHVEKALKACGSTNRDLLLGGQYMRHLAFGDGALGVRG